MTSASETGSSHEPNPAVFLFSPHNLGISAPIYRAMKSRSIGRYMSSMAVSPCNRNGPRTVHRALAVQVGLTISVSGSGSSTYSTTAATNPVHKRAVGRSSSPIVGLGGTGRGNQSGHAMAQQSAQNGSNVVPLNPRQVSTRTRRDNQSLCTTLTP